MKFAVIPGHHIIDYRYIWIIIQPRRIMPLIVAGLDVANPELLDLV